MAARATKNVMEFVKIRRGGERFWCRVLSKADNAMTLMCDNDTVDPSAPRRGEVFEAAADEEIVERLLGQPKLSVVF